MQQDNGYPQAPDNPGAPAAPAQPWSADGAAATMPPAPYDPNAAAQPPQPGAPDLSLPPAYSPVAPSAAPATPAAPAAMAPPMPAAPAPAHPGADPAALQPTAPAAPAPDAQQFVPQAPGAAPAEGGVALADDPAMAMPSLPNLPPAAPAAAAPTPAAPAAPGAAPAMPGVPGAPPGAPGAPAVPGAAAPGAPTMPTAPSLPGAPSMGAAPTMPTMPTMPAVAAPAGDAPAGDANLPQGRRPSGPDFASMGLKGATTMQLQGKKLRIGEVLIDMGLIDQGQLEHALKIQKETGQRLGKVLIQEGLVSSTDIARALSRRLAIEYVDVLEMALPPETLSLIPFDTCTRYDVVPIGEQGTGILVAMADPTNVFALDDLRLVTGRDIRVVVASPEAIDIVVSRMVSLDDAVDSAVDRADDWDEDHIPLEDIKNTEAEAPAVNLVNQIITQAVVTGASDLHFEPRSDDMVVRFRKDGVLAHITTVPLKLRAGVTSRLKIMASLDISERRKPQDGRVGLRVGDKPIDLRVASLPTVYGEKMVLRVLDKTNVMLDMSDLGFLPKQLEKLRYCYTQPYGCLLVTGPTGSGKSTTLYGAVNEINDVERNIITVEDPVEYRLRGINQVQINNKAGLTFPAALRSILRSDPDVVMIGEMRDYETAHIGIEASLTGHLVLSTLHTNDAPGAVTRLTEMGIEPYLVSSSVLGVLAQRLARRLCQCAEDYTPERDYLVEMKYPQWVLDKYDAEPFTLRKAVGCERCQHKGYKGRLGMHEVMLMSEAIAEAAIARASSEVIAKIAIEEGMITLFEDGVHKILMGQTTMEELQRIVQH